MKARIAVVMSVFVVAVAMASFIPSWAQEASTASANAAEPAASNDAQAPTKNWPAGNPLKIALLKWYQANLTTSFNVGKTQNSNPYGLAFDGQNVWSANSGEGTVTKLRASDGTNLGNFPAGNGPIGVAFDGASMWVANYWDGTVSKLRASDGKDLGTFSLGQGTYPGTPAFDGESMWVPNALGV